MFSAGELAIVRQFFPDVRTARGQANVAYRQRALSRLRDGRFPWLADPDKINAGTPDAWQPTILAELGRIDDEQLFFALAQQLCERRPATRVAIRLVRRHRSTRQRPSHKSGLLNVLFTAYNRYVESHVLEKSDVLNSVIIFGATVREGIGGEGDNDA